MTALQVAKSRSVARTEAHVAYRGDVANSEWEGLSATVGGVKSANGLEWGNVGSPNNFIRILKALGGNATSATINQSNITGFQVLAPATVIGGRLRVRRVTNGEIVNVRTATITGQQVDCLNRISPDAPLTQNSFEWAMPDFANRTATYTFGVAVIDVATGLIGPISTIALAGTGSTYTAVSAPTPTTTGSARTVTGRNGSLAAITGLTAQIRPGSTHNFQFSWNAASPATYVVFINWDGTSSRLPTETTVSFDSGPAVQAGDLLVFETGPLLTLSQSMFSRRVATASAGDEYGPSICFSYNRNPAGGRTWQYVPFDGALPKPDSTYPDHYLRLNGTASLPARAERFFHSGTDQSFYSVLMPGRVYRCEIIASAAAPMNATFAVGSATVASPATVALTTTPQTFTFDFSVAALIKSNAPNAWSFTGATNNVSMNILSVRLWDTSLPFMRLMTPQTPGTDMRDHNLIKAFPAWSFEALTSRQGCGRGHNWNLATLLSNCAFFGCNPHFQVEWFYEDQFYYDLVTFLFAPASSGEPLALKREAQGAGPVHTSFARYLYEDGNERWNTLMWLMYFDATDSVTGTVYSQANLCAMFAKRRRAIMESNPYWPASNPPIEFTGGWLAQPSFTVNAADFPQARYASVALYNSGWDVNRVLLADNAARWSDLLSSAKINQQSQLASIVSLAAGKNLKLAVYEAGPGYQLNGLNGAAVTNADAVIQEVVSKSIGGTTATMFSVANAALYGFGPYNFFTWQPGSLWSAARPDHEGGGLYRVAGYLAEMHKLLGRCRVYQTSRFIDRQRQVAILDTNGNFLRNENTPRAAIYHFESLTYPGRHGILYVNTTVNRDAFGVGHPDYQAGVTGAAEFRYHTGLPSNAVPFKVLRNEGNMRHHDAYKVGFRLNVVGSNIDGYVSDPLCVDLTVTPEDFTVTDPRLRTLTLLGGNCRLEVFTT